MQNEVGTSPFSSDTYALEKNEGLAPLSIAPIFHDADLGVVGDLFTILPALTEEVKKAKAH